jgi:FKBP-type peptidyl-prolyl cis-trans isomerase FkpA
MLLRFSAPPTRKHNMKQLLVSSALALSLTFTLAACDRAKAPPVAATPAVVFQKIDTVTGAGKEAVAGSTAVVNYTGWLYEPNAPQQRGKQFDTSNGRGPFDFRLGAGQVIKGWDEGVQGMKVGGKRTLIVPSAMGYGDSGAGPIPANATLMFDVELLDVR